MIQTFFNLILHFYVIIFMEINHLYVLSLGNMFNLITRAAVYLADICGLVKCLLVHCF